MSIIKADNVYTADASTNFKQKRTFLLFTKLRDFSVVYIGILYHIDGTRTGQSLEMKAGIYSSLYPAILFTMFSKYILWQYINTVYWTDKIEDEYQLFLSRLNYGKYLCVSPPVYFSFHDLTLCLLTVLESTTNKCVIAMRKQCKYRNIQKYIIHNYYARIVTTNRSLILRKKWIFDLVI